MFTHTQRKIRFLCTTEVTFYDLYGNIYIQTNRITMGSVLGLIFSNFYK